MHSGSVWKLPYCSGNLAGPSLTLLGVSENFFSDMNYFDSFSIQLGGHGGTVVTHSPPAVGGLNPGPYVRKLVVAY